MKMELRITKMNGYKIKPKKKTTVGYILIKA